MWTLPVTKASLSRDQPLLGMCLTYCRQCLLNFDSDNTEIKWAITKGHLPHNPDAPPTRHCVDTVISLLQIHKTHVDWLGKLPCPFHYPRKHIELAQHTTPSGPPSGKGKPTHLSVTPKAQSLLSKQCSRAMSTKALQHQEPWGAWDEHHPPLGCCCYGVVWQPTNFHSSDERAQPEIVHLCLLLGIWGIEEIFDISLPPQNYGLSWG